MHNDGAPRASWIAINTHPNKEDVAIANLDRQGFETYCPKLQRRIRHARKTQDVLRPMFPGYVFAAVLRDVSRWQSCQSTYGVRSVVHAGGTPCFLPDGFVEALRQREIGGAVVQRALQFRIGQRVRLAQGPFDDMIATIIEMNDRDRLVVLMELLSRRVRISVEASTVAELPRQ